MCGRCTSVCPAHATGKPLDPREIVLKVGEVMAATGSPGGVPADSAPTATSRSAPTRCSSASPPTRSGRARRCKACDEICPVNIEILDKILDMRRYLSLMESNFPAELGNAYRAMENQSNPWGMNQAERGDWAKDLANVKVVDPGEPLQSEYLYWVGLRRQLRRQEQEGHPGDGEAARASRHRRGDPRPERDVHRRSGAAIRQRIPVPDAGDAQHRDAQRRWA